VAETGSKNVYVPALQDIPYMTFHCCMNAVGDSITPTLLYEGSRVLSGYCELFPEALCCATPVGYQTEASFAAWTRVFVQESGAVPANPVVLLLDNHFSHLNLETLVYLRENGVRAVAMHPHTTHLLCALDKAYFRVFKAKMAAAVEQLSVSGGTLTKYTMAGCVRTAWKAASGITFDPATGARCSPVISGFRATGVFPFNRNVLTDEAFHISDALRAARDALDPLATAAAAALPPKLALSPEERSGIVKSLLAVSLPIEAKIKAAAKRGPQPMKAELLTSAEYLEREYAAAVAKEEKAAEEEVRRVERAARIAYNKNLKAEKAARWKLVLAAREEKKKAMAAGGKPKKARRGPKAAAVAGMA